MSGNFFETFQKNSKKIRKFFHVFQNKKTTIFLPKLVQKDIINQHSAKFFLLFPKYSPFVPSKPLFLKTFDTLGSENLEFYVSKIPNVWSRDPFSPPPRTVKVMGGGNAPSSLNFILLSE